VFREGLNTDGCFFRVSVFICVYLWLRTNTETLPRQLHAQEQSTFAAARRTT
jgi:hypothetical protein